MQDYQPRPIKFKELAQVNDWQVKIYVISKEDHFNATATYQNAVAQLPSWLALENSFDASNDKIAFLILHEGTEGVFSIINWWVGANMLNTHIFFSEHGDPTNFKKISGDGLCPCIWELEVINHERVSWIKNVLKQLQNPDYTAYLADNYNGTI